MNTNTEIEIVNSETKEKVELTNEQKELLQLLMKQKRVAREQMKAKIHKSFVAKKHKAKLANKTRKLNRAKARQGVPH